MRHKFQLYTALAVLCIALAWAVAPARAANAPQEIEVPAWFKVSFLDLRDDVKEAAAGGKRLMLYFGQNGCPYCRQLMTVNFRTPAIVATTRRHFDVVEINILGSRDVTWIDGIVRTEKAFARYLKVGYTPTLLIVDERGVELTRINGYLPPAPFSDGTRLCRRRRVSPGTRSAALSQSPRRAGPEPREPHRGRQIAKLHAHQRVALILPRLSSGCV